jgi:hypothetical protein
LSVETIAALADETAATLATMNTELTAAQAFHDPDLQPHAVQARRADLAELARTTASEAIASITARAESAATTAAKKLDGSRPKIPANDPAALIRAEQAWTYDVRPLLEAGASIKAILKTASLDELLAIERFAGGYLRAAKLAAGPGNPLELDPDELPAAVNNRLALTLPEGERATFEDGILTADAADKLQAIHEVAADTIAGRRPASDFEGRARALTLASRLRG